MCAALSSSMTSPPPPSDLVRAITPLPAILEMDFFKASSYGSGTQTSGHVKLDSGFDLRSIAGKHVLVVSGRSVGVWRECSGTQTSGHVKLDSGFNLHSIAGKHMLVVSGISVGRGVWREGSGTQTSGHVKLDSGVNLHSIAGKSEGMEGGREGEGGVRATGSVGGWG